MINGILIIDKPEGWTSHDVVAKVRGVVRQKSEMKQKQRVGHGGTLDPMATGVLPVFIGYATRAAQFCENACKEYIAGIRFGVVTDTQDITGNVISERSVSVNKQELVAALPQFLGQHKQIPPMYSAIKKDGKKLYELARSGVEIERPPRDIEIFELEVTDTPVNYEDEHSLFIRVACSKGTYIRTLCHDIGQKLGCGAVMSYLRRTKAGVYDISMAHRLDNVTGNFKQDMLLPVDSIFISSSAVILSEADSVRIKNGMKISLPGAEDNKYRFYSPGGDFILFGEVRSGQVIPIKSFYGA